MSAWPEFTHRIHFCLIFTDYKVSQYIGHVDRSVLLDCGGERYLDPFRFKGHHQESSLTREGRTKNKAEQLSCSCESGKVCAKVFLFQRYYGSLGFLKQCLKPREPIFPLSNIYSHNMTHQKQRAY